MKQEHLEIGVDVESIRMMRKNLKPAERKDFLEALFTPLELTYFQNNPASITARIAIKEAVGKTLGTGVHIDGWKAIEVLTDRHGRIVVKLNGEAKEQAEETDLSCFTTSIVFGNGNACAFVIGSNFSLHSSENPLFLGADVTSIKEVEKKLQEHNNNFLGQTYSTQERALYNHNYASLAARLAAKKVISKAIGADKREIEILPVEYGKVTVNLSDTGRTLADERGFRNLLVSLAHEHDEDNALAIAFVAAIVNCNRVDRL